MSTKPANKEILSITSLVVLGASAQHVKENILVALRLGFDAGEIREALKTVLGGAGPDKLRLGLDAWKQAVQGGTTGGLTTPNVPLKERKRDVRDHSV